MVAKGGGEPGGSPAAGGVAANAVAVAVRAGTPDADAATAVVVTGGAARTAAAGAAAGAGAVAEAALAGTSAGGVKAAHPVSVATAAQATGRRVLRGMAAVDIGRGTLVSRRSAPRSNQQISILRQRLCPLRHPDYTGRDKVCT